MTTGLMFIFFVLVVGVQLHTTSAEGSHAPVICADSENGTCTLEKEFDFCSVNTTAGTFGCDPEQKCVANVHIRGTLKSTCVGGGLCCCNKAGFGGTAEFCNYATLRVLKSGKTNTKMNATIWCEVASAHGANEAKPLKHVDVYCTHFMYRREESKSGGGYVKSGQSFMHRNVQMYEEHHPSFITQDGFGMLADHVINKPKFRCSQLVEYGKEGKNGALSACVEIKFKHMSKRYVGHYCCCEGADNCNSDISWDHETVDENAMTAGATSVHAIASLVTVLVATLLKPTL